MNTFFQKLVLKMILVTVLFVFISAVLITLKPSREYILRSLGDFLFIEPSSRKADILVVLRGDNNFSRTIEAAKLYRKGSVKQILIPQDLYDENQKKLEKMGVNITSGQEIRKSILLQFGVCKEDIILDESEPGGGTSGEAERVKSFLKSEGIRSGLIVTNWWHTKRVNSIYQKSFQGENISFLVDYAKDDLTSPDNWWHFRYEAINILEEYPKLLLAWISSFFELSFKDDPGDK